MAKLKNMTETNNGYPSHLRDIQDDGQVKTTQLTENNVQKRTDR